MTIAQQVIKGYIKEACEILNMDSGTIKVLYVNKLNQDAVASYILDVTDDDCLVINEIWANQMMCNETPTCVRHYVYFGVRKIYQKNVIHNENFFRTPESDIDAYAFSYVVQSLKGLTVPMIPGIGQLLMLRAKEILNIDLILPTGWEDLTDKQLRYVFALLSQGFTATEVKAYCLFRWSGMQVMHRYGKGWYCKFSKDEFVLFSPQINAAIASLDWIDTLPTMPVRLAKIGSHRAVDAQFQGVPFETFIVCDNIYQGYLATKQDELLYELAGHLYSSKFRVESLGFRDLLGRLFPPYAN